MEIIKKIYEILYKAHGRQGWWPVTPNWCHGRENRPIYHVLTRTENQRFEICLGAILTQNTAWKNVEKAIENLNKHHLIDIDELSKIKKEKLAQLIRSAGYFNQKAERLILFSRFVRKKGIKNLLNAETAELRKELLSLNGIGPETADSMILYAFDKVTFVIDAYTRRIMSRIGICKEDASYEELQKIFHDGLDKDRYLFNEYHALLVEHAKRYCKKKPECKECTLRGLCKHGNRLV
ncbi:endonuclease [Candidatus Woesearchaeota archaeon]|nr:endonuclease [Candidatus Woesearchaeota archaeon]